MKNTWPILVFISLLFFNGSAAVSISGDWKPALWQTRMDTN
jgi:hypothetical protein